jgi:hypothetical protein
MNLVEEVKELKVQLSQSPTEHGAAVKAESTQSKQLESREHRLTKELALIKKASDRMSAELDMTKGKLDKVTATGMELSGEVKELKGQLARSQKEHDAAMKARSALAIQQVKDQLSRSQKEHDAVKKAQSKTATEEFLYKETQLSRELASYKKADIAKADAAVEVQREICVDEVSKALFASMGSANHGNPDELPDARLELTKRMVANLFPKSRQKPPSDASAAAHHVSVNSSHDMPQNAASLSAPPKAPSP